MLDVVHLLAEARGREPLQRDLVARRRLVGDQRVGGVDAELGLAGAGGRAATQPGELLLGQLQALLLRGRRHPVALGAGQHVGGVAAVVGVDRAVVDLPRGLVDLVEEPPVVGDDQVRPAAVLQEAGQPGDALDVEVVGRLVEDDEVPLADEQGGQGDAPALATGHAVDDGVETDLVQAEAVEDRAHLRVAGPGVLGGVAQDRLVRGEPLVDPHVLGERADPQAAGVRHATGVRLLGLQQRLEQRGLAAAVAADDADAVVVGDAERAPCPAAAWCRARR